MGCGGGDRQSDRAWTRRRSGQGAGGVSGDPGYPASGGAGWDAGRTSELGREESSKLTPERERGGRAREGREMGQHNSNFELASEARRAAERCESQARCLVLLVRRKLWYCVARDCCVRPVIPLQQQAYVYLLLAALPALLL